MALLKQVLMNVDLVEKKKGTIRSVRGYLQNTIVWTEGAGVGFTISADNPVRLLNFL